MPGSGQTTNSLPTGLITGDARDLVRNRKHQIPRPDAIITSPPYFDLHDYGHSAQIGHGQTLAGYLSDIERVFGACYATSTDNAVMAIVVGSIHRDGELIQLPYEITAAAKRVGWIPREEAIWNKNKALPWAMKNTLRDLTEHIVIFSKTSYFDFNFHDLLDPKPRSMWWVRYPERYSPSGRRPSNVWNIPIPTQGSWKNGPRHFCPFPEQLTFQLLSLITKPGDVVLDPFAGVGSVPAMANAMGRHGIGIEISGQYSDQYLGVLNRARRWWENYVKGLSEITLQRQVFYRTIVELRLLKYAQKIGKALAQDRSAPDWIEVLRSPEPSRSQYKIVKGVFRIKLHDQDSEQSVLETSVELARQRPLSKFGIESDFRLVKDPSEPPGQFWYLNGEFWKPPIFTKPDETGFHVVADFMPDISSVQSWS